MGVLDALENITRHIVASSVVFLLAGLLGGAGEAEARTPKRGCFAQAGQRCSTGIASWYGSELQGHRTASGELFNRRELTAAHPSLPFQTRLRVTNPKNGRSVTVRINDRGPGHGRAIDLSEEAARQLGIHGIGAARVEMRLAQNVE
jgi:rare lipoprotein A